MLPATGLAPGESGVRRVVIDLGLDTERRVRALEFKPGNRSLVRAATFWLQDGNQWLGSWTPWYGISALPEGTAFQLPAGSKIVAEIHYQAARQESRDAGTLGVHFATTSVSSQATNLVVEARARAMVEGRAKGFREFAGSLTLSEATTLIAFKPDQRLGVDSFAVTAKKPDGAVQPLLLVRGALADWPTPYVLKQPALLPPKFHFQFL